MFKASLPSESHREIARKAKAEKGLVSAAESFGFTPHTLRRVLDGKTVSPVTLSKLIVDRTRKAEDFNGGATVREHAPRRRQPDTLWSLEKIREARDAQMRGDFAQAVRLAEAMRTDDALYTAYLNRIAPQSAVAAKLVPYDAARGEAVARKAQASCHVSRTVIAGIAGTLANHGIAIGHIIRETNDEGTRVDLRLTEWPLEFVKWNTSTEQLETTVKDGGMRVPIVHGDGDWIVFRKTDICRGRKRLRYCPRR
jgi:hypothetical protein